MSADLQAQLGRLKRAAIDAWMHDYRSEMIGGWRANGSHYYAPPWAVTRPGEDGNGGGYWTVGEHEPVLSEDRYFFVTSFQTIRNAIDELFAPWLDLPDPEALAPLIESARQVTRGLSAGASEDGVVTGAGELAGYVTLVEQTMDTLTGDLMGSFKAKFLVQLKLAISGFSMISLVRGASVAAQQEIWRVVPESLRDIVEQAIDAFEGVSVDSPTNWKAVVQVVGLAVEGLSLFVPGAGIPAAVTTFGLKVLEQNVPEPVQEERAANSYTEAMTLLADALRGLSRQIATEELALHTNLQDNLRHIRSDASSYDLSQPPVYPGGDGFFIDRRRVEEIYGTYLPAVADALDAVAGRVLESNTAGAVRRDARIGMGPTGPSDSVSEINWLLYELIKELAWEARGGAKALELAILDLEAKDQQIAAELTKLAEQITQGSPYTPWGGTTTPWFGPNL